MSSREKDRLCFRLAGPEDVALLRHWDEQPHVQASDPDGDWQWETELLRRPAWREQLIAELDGRPLGFVQIMDPATPDEPYWGDVGPNLRAIDIWIGEAEDLGKGHGTRMMTLAIERCFANPGVTAILIDPLASNTRAHRFYQRLGFVPTERRMFGEDDCLVHRLERSDWESRGLRDAKTKSPAGLGMTAALAELDAESRFRIRAAKGSMAEGLRLLDRLDRPDLAE